METSEEYAFYLNYSTFMDGKSFLKLHEVDAAQREFQIVKKCTVKEFNKEIDDLTKGTQ